MLRDDDKHEDAINGLLGKTLTTITPMSHGSDGIFELIFVCEDGSRYRMFHDQDCCEHVYLAETIGDLADLIGSPILSAECVSQDAAEELGELSATWTFYKLGTIKGHVTLRWLGTSKGYYSERVDFVREG